MPQSESNMILELNQESKIYRKLNILCGLCEFYNHNVEMNFTDNTGVIAPLYSLSDNVYKHNGLTFVGDDIWKVNGHSIYIV